MRGNFQARMLTRLLAVAQSKGPAYFSNNLSISAVISVMPRSER